MGPSSGSQCVKMTTELTAASASSAATWALGQATSSACVSLWCCTVQSPEPSSATRVEEVHDAKSSGRQSSPTAQNGDGAPKWPEDSAVQEDELAERRVSGAALCIVLDE